MSNKIETTTIDSFTGKYSFLSNFYPCTIFFNGQSYPSLEHAYQAAKTLDAAIEKLIRCATSPARAKKLGRQIQLRKDWEELKKEVMEILVEIKFVHCDLRKQLLATGEAILIEENRWHDNIWGSCTCQRCGNKGRNLLGKIIMAERTNIRDE